LDPATSYSYRVLLDGATKHSGTFRTLPTSGPLKFAYGADSKLTFRPFVAADAMAQQQPHFAILGGDQIYADQFMSIHDTRPAYEARYRQTFADGPLRALMQKVPMFMIWDDHDIQNNWDSRQKGRYENARHAYNEYQGSHNPGNNSTVYYSFRASDVDFFVLDTRTYRSERCAENNDSCTRNEALCFEGTSNLCAPPSVCDLCQTMLGKTQRDALLQWLSRATGKFKIIVSSVPFDDSVTEEFDAWRGYMKEKTLIFDYIKNNQIGGVVLLSGDQHWVGVFKVDYRKSTGTDNQPYLLYEFSPTPMGNSTRDLPASPSNAEYLSKKERGFGLFTVDAGSPNPTQQKLKFQWVYESGEVDPDPGATQEITRAQISPW
jgi:phosphodiesterase/alkaline phosphatase D-like protein